MSKIELNKLEAVYPGNWINFTIDHREPNFKFQPALEEICVVDKKGICVYFLNNVCLYVGNSKSYSNNFEAYLRRHYIEAQWGNHYKELFINPLYLKNRVHPNYVAID
jgi:hypothetical protein